MFSLDDTIAAIASAPGAGLRGIIRLSGPQCVSVVARVGQFDQAATAVLQAGCLAGVVDLPDGLGPVPVTLYLWPTARSYTREPSAELHLPGSPPVLNAALAAVCAAGARLAQPGEFTLRAFLGGRLDLTQAEAVLGVIEASDRRQLETALDQLAGGIARPLGRLRETLLDLVAHLEAGLDFVDEDIEFIGRAELGRQLAEIDAEIAGLRAQMASRTEASELPRVVLYGLPNTGKSSLLNSLAGEPAALVSEIAGTTRDYVARAVRVLERTILVSDTAGVAEAVDGSVLDRAMQNATAAERRRAAATILCLDVTRPLASWELEEFGREDERRLIVATKCDLAADGVWGYEVPAIRTSSVTGLGLGELKAAIAGLLESQVGEAGVIAPTAERCRESLRHAAEALRRARELAGNEGGDELIAAELRLALEELGRVGGAIYTDDILDRVFSRFCIGK